MNVNAANTHYTLNNAANGHVKIWDVNTATGDKQLLLDKPNLITKLGAGVLASALAGLSNAGVTHFYVGYCASGVSPSETGPTIDDNISSFISDANNGYLRIPLSFPASFLTESGYASANATYFTTFITSGSFGVSTGMSFANGVKFYALGLINAQSYNDPSSDRLFSKIYFGPIVYDSTHGLAITWGITFRAVAP